MYYGFATFLERHKDSKTIWKHNAFLVVGEDASMKEEAIHAIKGRLSGTIRTAVFDKPKESEILEVLSDENPLIGEQRFVISAKSFSNLNRAAKLVRLIPALTQRVVFLEREESKFEGAFYDAVKKDGVVVSCTSIRDYDKSAGKLMARFLEEELKQTIDPESWVIKQLLRKTGSNVLWMRNVAKTVNLLQAPLTEQLVDKYIDAFRSDSVFDLMFLVATGNMEKALTVYRSIAAQDDSALLVLDQMAEYLLRVWTFNKIRPERRTPTYFSQTLKWSDFLVRRYTYMSKFYESTRIKHSLDRIDSAYEHLGVSSNNQLVIAVLLKDLCDNRRMSPAVA